VPVPGVSTIAHHGISRFRGLKRAIAFAKVLIHTDHNGDFRFGTIVEAIKTPGKAAT